jgi:hypothetical protein
MKTLNDYIFAPMFELFGLNYQEQFSNDLFDNMLYIAPGFFFLTTAFAFMILFYWVLDHPRYAKWYHWLITILICASLNFVFNYFWTQTEINLLYAEQELPHYSNELLLHGFTQFLWSFVFCVVFSFALKWKSVSTRKTPI